MDQVIEKEIAETTTSIASQHSQCQWYVQTYLVAITGLFAIAAFFAKDGKLTILASSVGIVFATVVFFMGWVFLSVIAHKVSMIHMLYKHLAGMRDLRTKAHPELNSVYTLPKGSYRIKQASLITQLPYLFFVFNFVLLTSALFFFLSPHNHYFQTVAVVSAVCTALGTFYPVVCISFNKHITCAYKAKNMQHKQELEAHWTNEVREKKRPFRWLKVLTLLVANIGAALIAIYALVVPQDRNSSLVIIWMCYVGLTLYGLLRFAMERWRLKVGVKAVRIGDA